MFQPAAPRVVVPLVLIRNAELSCLVPVVLLQIAARNLCQWSCYCYSSWVGGRSCQQQRFVVPMVLLMNAELSYLVPVVSVVLMMSQVPQSCTGSDEFSCTVCYDAVSRPAVFVLVSFSFWRNRAASLFKHHTLLGA